MDSMWTSPGLAMTIVESWMSRLPSAGLLSIRLSTALWMSRLNCGVPIYALTSQTATRYRCALFRDTYPLMMKHVGTDREELLREAEIVLVQNGVVKDGDLIVLTIGEPIGKPGGTNTMKIVKIGEHREQ